MDLETSLALVNKPPIEEIVNFDLVNKPPIDELYHHGILGMRWGIRRYQNPDGSLTPEGQRRLDRKTTKEENKRRKKEAKEQAKREKMLKNPELLKKNIDKFSEEEVTRAMQNFAWQDKISEIKKHRSDANWRKAEDIADKAITVGNYANAAITFLNTPAGKELRNKLGFGTNDIGSFKTPEEIAASKRAVEKAKLELNQLMANSNKAVLEYNKANTQWEWDKADRHNKVFDEAMKRQNDAEDRERQVEKSQLDLDSARLKYAKDYLNYQKDLAGNKTSFDPDDYEAFDPDDEERKYRLRRVKHAATNDFLAYSDYLMHYGVKGMKWGVRRYQDKNGRLTAEGKEHYGTGKSAANQEKGMSVLAAMAAYYGVVFGATALIYAGAAAADAVESHARNKRLYKDDNPNKITPETLNKVNPKYGNPEYSKNCTKCAVTTELVSRGITDYQAGKSNGGYTCKDQAKWFKGAKVKEVTTSETAYNDYFDKLKTGSSGVMGFTYEGGMGGHSIHWTKLENDVRFEDGQNGRSYSLKEFMKEYKPASGYKTEITRLDNCEPDYKKMREYEVIEPVEKKGR